MIEDHITSMFRPNGISRGGELYLTPLDAQRMADACAQNGLAVVGVDAAVLEPGATIPQGDLVADFSGLRGSSWAAFVEECNRQCRTFIAALPDRSNLFLTLTVIGESG